MAAMAIVTSAFAFVPLDIDLWWLRALMFVRGLCMASALLPLQASAYSNISPSDTGRATAIYTAQRQTFAALGVAVVASVWLSRSAGVALSDTAGRLGAFHVAFAVSAGILLLSSLAAAFIRDEDAAATMRGRARPEAELVSELEGL
jgi:hypothetical protein